MVIVAPVVSDRGEKLEMEGVAAGAGVGIGSSLFLQPSTISHREKINKDNDRNNDVLNLMIIQLGRGSINIKEEKGRSFVQRMGKNKIY